MNCFCHDSPSSHLQSCSAHFSKTHSVARHLLPHVTMARQDVIEQSSGSPLDFATIGSSNLRNLEACTDAGCKDTENGMDLDVESLTFAGFREKRNQADGIRGADAVAAVGELDFYAIKAPEIVQPVTLTQVFESPAIPDCGSCGGEVFHFSIRNLQAKERDWTKKDR